VKSRSLYHFLLRLHPSHFRSKFEDQMFWIFDESVSSRGAASLLLDALVSLVRQWVLRSSYWRHTQPPIAIDGATALTDQLRRNAETLHRRAWRLNLLWMIGAFAVLLLSRVQMFWGPFVIIIFINAVGVYVQSRAGRRGIDDPRNLYRQRIKGRREGLLRWCGSIARTTPLKAGWNLGGKNLLVMLVITGLDLLLHPMRAGSSYDWVALFEFLLGLIVVSVSWRFVKKVSQHAARAIQDELEAMEPSTPQSV
jgi:hypothetical protein